jgi:hypothetical protein
MFIYVLALIGILEFGFTILRKISPNKQIFILLVLCLSIAYSSWMIGIQKLMNSKNLYVELGLTPHSPLSLVLTRCQELNATLPIEEFKKFIPLTNHNHRQQYFIYGEVNETLNESDFDKRVLNCIAFYLGNFLVLIVFCSARRAKRVLFILTVFLCLYEIRL